jgi:hypothetical protein
MTKYSVRETRYPAVVAQQIEPLGQFVIVACNRARVAPGAQVRGGIETEAYGIRQRSGAAPSLSHFDPGAVRLTGILDYLQRKCAGNLPQLIDWRGQTVQMCGKNYTRAVTRAEAAGLQVASHSRRVHVTGNRINIDEYRPGADPNDRLNRRDKSHEHGDHFISGANSHRLERKA